MSAGNPLMVDIGQGLSLMVGMTTINSWSTDQRPQSAKRGTLGFNSDTQSLEYFDGTNWFGAKLSNIS